MSAFQYEILVQNGIVIIRFYSKATAKDIIELLELIAEKYPTEKRLWDLTQCDFNVSYKELSAIAEHSKGIFEGPCKIAFLTPQGFTYGQINQFRIHREDDRCQVMQFLALDDAMAWLNN